MGIAFNLRWVVALLAALLLPGKADAGQEVRIGAPIVLEVPLPSVRAEPLAVGLLLSPIPPRHTLVVRLEGESSILAAFIRFGPIRGPVWYDVILPPLPETATHIRLALSLEGGDGSVTLLQTQIKGGIAP